MKVVTNQQSNHKHHILSDLAAYASTQNVARKGNFNKLLELKCAGAAPMRTATDEISLCRCYIETMFTMEIGTRLSLALSLKDDVIRCMGVVATKYPQVGNGIDFVDMGSRRPTKIKRIHRGA